MEDEYVFWKMEDDFTCLEIKDGLNWAQSSIVSWVLVLTILGPELSWVVSCYFSLDFDNIRFLLVILFAFNIRKVCGKIIS